MDTFEDYRPLMFSIAYRMLGSAMDAEDIVQEAYLRYQATPPESIRSLKAFLSTVVTRLCLNQLASARVQRETYIGPWLPEPLLTRGDGAALFSPASCQSADDSISMAFLVLLESLSPSERAVFLLREVFDYEYGEIAEMLGKEEAACRQLFSRAKKHIAQNRPRFKASPQEQTLMIQRFLQAVSAGDLDGLMNLLSASVTLWSDGGGKARAATRPLQGRATVARFLLGIQRFATPDMRVEMAEVNGAPGLILRSGAGKALVVLTFEVGDGLFQAFRFILNPEKIARL
jgi:RNA polymerase sigma-70 factor (ECF subfamily)